MAHAIGSSIAIPDHNQIVPNVAITDQLQVSDFDGFKKALSIFIENLSDEKIYSILRNAGSIWIDADDALNDNISVKSLVALGLAHDSITTQHAFKVDAILALDLEGLGDMFVFQDDDESVMPHPSIGETLYSPISGRSALLSCIQNSEGDFDSFCIRLDEYSEDQNRSTFRG